MIKNIENYVNSIFLDIPKNQKSIQLRKKTMINMNNKYESYLEEGKTERQAYDLTIVTSDDISKHLEELMPTNEFIEHVNKYKQLNAIAIAVSTAMYIMCPIPIFIAVIFDSGYIFGIIGLLAIVAVASAILVYSESSMPLEIRSYLERYDVNYDEKYKFIPEQEIFTTMYWLIILSFYLIFSFYTESWSISWVIWIIASVVHKSVQYIGYKKNKHL